MNLVTENGLRSSCRFSRICIRLYVFLKFTCHAKQQYKLQKWDTRSEDTCDYFTVKLTVSLLNTIISVKARRTYFSSSINLRSRYNIAEASFVSSGSNNCNNFAQNLSPLIQFWWILSAKSNIFFFFF